MGLLFMALLGGSSADTIVDFSALVKSMKHAPRWWVVRHEPAQIKNPSDGRVVQGRFAGVKAAITSPASETRKRAPTAATQTRRRRYSSPSLEA